MNIYDAEYQQKLTTPQKAVEKIQNGDTVVQGMANAEPPAILAAIAERVREGDLKHINCSCSRSF
jgi:itaconate CoA-transferase